MKYFIKQNEVYAFESDGSQDFLITDDFVLMSDDEADRHCYPEKYLSDEEKEAIKIASYPMLTGHQFHMTLVMNNLEEAAKQAIALIEDPMQRAIADIEFNKANGYRRMGTSVLFMQKELGMSDDELNKLWEQALAIPD